MSAPGPPSDAGVRAKSLIIRRWTSLAEPIYVGTRELTIRTSRWQNGHFCHVRNARLRKA